MCLLFRTGTLVWSRVFFRDVIVYHASRLPALSILDKLIKVDTIGRCPIQRLNGTEVFFFRLLSLWFELATDVPTIETNLQENMTLVGIQYHCWCPSVLFEIIYKGVALCMMLLNIYIYIYCTHLHGMWHEINLYIYTYICTILTLMYWQDLFNFTWGGFFSTPKCRKFAGASWFWMFVFHGKLWEDEDEFVSLLICESFFPLFLLFCVFMGMISFEMWSCKQIFIGDSS